MRSARNWRFTCRQQREDNWVRIRFIGIGTNEITSNCFRGWARIVVYILSDQWYHLLAALHWSVKIRVLAIVGWKWYLESMTQLMPFARASHPTNASAIAFHSAINSIWMLPAISPCQYGIIKNSGSRSVNITIDNSDPVVTWQRHWIVATSIFIPLHCTNLVWFGVFFFSSPCGGLHWLF